MDDISSELEQLKLRVAQLEQEREEGERISRMPLLILSGQDLRLPENDERLMTVVVAVIDRLLEIDVHPGQIISVTRLPRDRLLVRFASSEKGSLRDLVFRTKGSLKGHKIYINESLTPRRQEAFNMLLQLRKQGLLSTVMSRGGEIFIAKEKGTRLTKIKNKNDAEVKLNQLLEQDSHLSYARSLGAAPGAASARAGGPVPPLGAGSAAAAASGAGERAAGRPGAAPMQSMEEAGGGPAGAGGPVGAPCLAPPLAGRRDPCPPADLRGGGERVAGAAAACIGGLAGGGPDSGRGTRSERPPRAQLSSPDRVQSRPEDRAGNLVSPPRRRAGAGVGEAGRGQYPGEERRHHGPRPASVPAEQGSGDNMEAVGEQGRHLPPTRGNSGGGGGAGTRTDSAEGTWGERAVSREGGLGGMRDIRSYWN